MPLFFRQPIRVRKSAVVRIFTCVWITLSATSASNAHDEFKEVLEKRYRLKSVSCKACHTDNKDKQIRNAFGKLLHQELEDKDLTKRYEAAKEEGDDAKKKFEKQMTKEFTVALEAVEKKPVTFLALLEAGLLNGTRLDKNQVDADTLTIKTLTDSQVEEIKVGNASLIEGEIQQMPSKENEPSAEKSEKTQDDSTPEPKPDATGSKLEPDDNSTENPSTPAASDDADKPE